MEGKRSTLADSERTLHPPNNPNNKLSFADMVKLLHFKQTKLNKQQIEQKQRQLDQQAQHNMQNRQHTNNTQKSNTPNTQMQDNTNMHKQKYFNPNQCSMTEFVERTDEKYANFKDEKRVANQREQEDKTSDPFEAFFNANLNTNKLALEMIDLFREKYISMKNSNKECITQMETAKSRLSTLLNKIFFIVSHEQANGETMATKYRKGVDKLCPENAMTVAFAYPMIVELDRLINKMLTDEWIITKYKMSIKMKEVRMIMGKFFRKEKRINTMMLNRLGYLCSELREILIQIDRRKEYYKGKKAIENTRKIVKKETDISQYQIQGFRKEVMKMCNESQSNKPNRKIEAVTEVLKERAHCSNLERYIAYEAKDRGLADQSQVEALAIRILQKYASRPAPVWRECAQDKITEIAKEAINFSQKLTKKKEISMEEINAAVKNKIIVNKDPFMMAVHKQFVMSDLENSAETITSIAMEELCHQLRLPLESIVNNDFVRKTIQEFANKARTEFFQKERKRVEINNAKKEAVKERIETAHTELLKKCQGLKYRSNLIDTVIDRVAARHLLPDEAGKVLVEELNTRWEGRPFGGVISPQMETLLKQLTAEAETEFSKKFLNKRPKENEQEVERNDASDREMQNDASDKEKDAKSPAEATIRESSPVLIPTPVRRKTRLNEQTPPKKRWTTSRLQTMFIAPSCRNWKMIRCVRTWLRH